MNIIEIIDKKKNKCALNEAEIKFFINNFVFTKKISDYQASALLMAMTINGLDDNEIYFLTKHFVETSKCYNFKKHPKHPLVDKHSSGGVGDKVSIIVIPILVALGIDVVKISGRGLGHTGGTIDKLDAIDFKSDLSMNDANKVFDKIHTVLFQQTADLVPADKAIYQLRDVTGSVNCSGLIASSILSKKFVLNSDYIFLDLKVGTGALIEDEKAAEDLAKKMLKVADKMGRNLFVSLTPMYQPLGHYVGNFLEIKECIEFLQGVNQANDLKNLVYDFLNDILITTKKTKSKSESIKAIDAVLNDLSAYLVFIEWLKMQKANINKIDSYHEIEAKYKLVIKANKTGYLSFLSAKEVGLIALELGAGRKQKDDKLDFLAGIHVIKKYNDFVKKDEIIAVLYSSKPINKKLSERYLANVSLNKCLNKPFPNIIKTLSNIKC